MNQSKANLYFSAGKVLRAVTVYFDMVTDSAGMKSWFGVFQLPIGELVEVGGPYRMHFDDGRMGNILITNLTVSSHSPSQVSFIGTGPIENAP